MRLLNGAQPEGTIMSGAPDSEAGMAIVDGRRREDPVPLPTGMRGLMLDGPYM